MFRLAALLCGLLLCVPPLVAQNRDFQTQRLILDDDATDGTRNTLTLQPPLLLPQNTIVSIPDPGSTSASFLLTESSSTQTVNADIDFTGTIDFTTSNVIGLKNLSDGMTILGTGIPVNRYRLNMAHANNWIAVQNFNAVMIDGGTIDATVIGGSTPAPGSFTNLELTGWTAVGDGIGPDDLTVTLGTGEFTIVGLQTENSPAVVLTANGANEVRSTSLADLATAIGSSSAVSTDGTLSGDGSGGNPLGLNLANANTWSHATTLGDGDVADATTFNTGAGPDLLLGEDGLDRSGAADQTFTFDNSGAGDLDVMVNGDFTGNGDLSIGGSTTLDGAAVLNAGLTVNGASSFTGATTLNGTTVVNGALSNTANVTLAGGAGSDATIGNTTGATTIEGMDLDIGPAGATTIDIGNGGSTTTLDGTVVFSQAPTLPLSTGAILLGDGSNEAEELAAGSNGQVLTVVGGTPAWATPTGGGGGWGTTGNGGTTAGTNFLGTTDNVDLTIVTNNTEKVRIESGGDVGIGVANPSQKLEVSDGNILLSNSGTAGELRFAEPGAGGSDYTAFRAGVQTASVTYTLPASDGTGGNVLATDGSGGLSWVNPNQSGAVGSELFAAKGSDETITNVGTLQNDDDLTVSLESGTTYSVEGFLYARTNSNNAEVLIGFDVPTGATLKVTYVAYDGANNIKGGGFLTTDGAASNAIDVSSAASTDVAIWFRGLVRTATTAGDLQLQWAQDAPGAGRSTTIETDSFMEAKRVE